MSKKTINTSVEKKKRLLSGVVVSDKMDKTLVVSVTRTFKHPLFGKVLKSQKNYKVHDEKKEAQKGDFIEFQEGRPLSKTKHMYLTRIVKKSDADALASVG